MVSMRPAALTGVEHAAASPKLTAAAFVADQPAPPEAESLSVHCVAGAAAAGITFSERSAPAKAAPYSLISYERGA